MYWYLFICFFIKHKIYVCINVYVCIYECLCVCVLIKYIINEIYNFFVMYIHPDLKYKFVAKSNLYRTIYLHNIFRKK